jgi:hypothetical protein
VCKRGPGLLLAEGVTEGYSKGRVREGQGYEAAFMPQARYKFMISGFESWTNNLWMIASKVHVVGPHKVIKAGPSRLLEHPGPSSKGEGRVVEFLETGAVEGSKTYGMSDEQ